ncbi:hypothetical protein WJX77_004006 [Trebouxia sp. C0004]
MLLLTSLSCSLAVDIVMSDTMKEATAKAATQDKRKGPTRRPEPPKKVQMIEPVLRRAPQYRAPSESTAAFLRGAKTEANLPDSMRPRRESSAAAGSRSSNSRSESAQEELYTQQVQDALREGSPDVRRDARSASQQVQKRPTSKLAPHRQRPVSPAQQAQQDLSERMHQHVLGGRLWYKECQDANQDLPEQLPMNYDSPEHYVSTFEPLLFEEAREVVRSTWVESCDMKRTFTVDITSVDETASGSVHLHLKPSMPGNRSSMLRENSLVVLTLSKPPAKGALEWVQGGRGKGARRQNNIADDPHHKRQRRDLDQQEGHAGMGPEAYNPDGSGGNPMRPPPPGIQQWASSGSGLSPDQQRQIVAEAEAAVGRKHSLLPVVAGVVKSAAWDMSGDIFVTIFPACSTHAHAPGSCCHQVIQSLRDKPKAWHLGFAGALISQEREYKALREVKNMKVGKYILRPQLLAEIGAEMEDHQTMRRMWPPEARTPQFLQFIRDQYDQTQQAAIEIAACHLGKNAQTNMEDPSLAILPFVLIQGPPGTGKTHTVCGILNVWHIVHYNRFLESLVKALVRESWKESASSGLNRTLPNLARKPRILVCAPSNAATDELLQRIMDHGFKDFQGNTYRPNVVRIGSEEAPVSQRAKDVWVDVLINRYMDMDSATWQRRYTHLQEQVTKQTYQVAAVQKALQRTQDEQEQLEKALSSAAEKGKLQEQIKRSVAEGNTYSHQLAHLHEERDKALVEMSRLEEVAPLARSEHGQNKRMVRDNLELSFVQEAEMVFTTLSSTGRKIFNHLENAFENVLVDEAAQASEIAVLQPLMLGCKRVVLVGDPQQLPATVLSRQAQLANMERSMFERFQKAGCPVTMLSVQYRMHPFIRQFPSQHFYNNQLLDGASVIAEANSRDVMYDHGYMKPYIFFDVSTGRETRQGTGSLRNQGEADLAAALFFKLRSILVDAHHAKKEGVKATKVGVITPYRQQRKCLQDTFFALCAENAKEVVIETVDSFQGKQMDVVIMSCVRASEPGSQTGIGFVSDIRRMNVAITRAKRALWILGSAATLKASPVWQALIDDAEQRGTIVKDATAEKLFPDMTELLLMQANKRSPAPEPHPAALDRLPQEARVDPQVVHGITAQVVGHGPHKGRAPMGGGMGGAQRGTGGQAGDDAGRGASQRSQGVHHGGQRGPHMGQAISHVMDDSVEHMMHAPAGQRVAPAKEVTACVQSDPRQGHLTPAQFAIQQGKLQQQMEQQQQLSQSQQQQQQQQLAQHSQWDSAYPDAVPRDPRQAPGIDGTGSVSSSWQAAQGQQPGWLHSQYLAEARPGFGHEDAQPSAGHWGPNDPSGSHVMECSQQSVNFPQAHHEAGPAKDPRRMQSNGFAPAVAQLASPTHLGRNGLQPSAETPQVPQWTNNRR